MRYAIYYTPGEAEPLTRAAQSWIGRNAFTDMAVAPRAVGDMSAAEIAFHAASARRYGFHATLKAPFRLAETVSERELVEAFDIWTAQRQSFVGPRLVIGQIDGFFALLPETKDADLDALAHDVVVDFDQFRAPSSEADIARRNPDGLTTRQVGLLHEWGYPYVMDEFRFHMTLTGRVGAHDAPRVKRSLTEHFNSLLDDPVEFASLALFVEREAGAPFTVCAFREFGAEPSRKTA